MDRRPLQSPATLPASDVSLGDDELLAVLAEIERNQRATAAAAAAAAQRPDAFFPSSTAVVAPVASVPSVASATAAAAAAPSVYASLYDELVRYQEEHDIQDDSAAALGTAAQGSPSSGALSDWDDYSSSDRKPAARPAGPAIPGQRYRKPISRNLLNRRTSDISDTGDSKPAAVMPQLSEHDCSSRSDSFRQSSSSLPLALSALSPPSRTPSFFSVPGNEPTSLEWQESSNVSLDEDEALARRLQAEEEALISHQTARTDDMLTNQMASLMTEDEDEDERAASEPVVQQAPKVPVDDAVLVRLSPAEIEEQRQILHRIESQREAAKYVPPVITAECSLASGQSTATTRSASSEVQEQQRLLQRIREQQEHKELKQALNLSEHEVTPARCTWEPNTEEHGALDYVQSQRAALTEYTRPAQSQGSHEHSELSAMSNVSRDLSPNHSRRVSPTHHDLGDTYGQVHPDTRQATPHHNDTRYSPHAPSNHRDDEGEGYNRHQDMVQRGLAETQQAVQEGQSHVVACQGCGGRLHAPVHYSLVYCPKCGVISPGQSAPSHRALAQQRQGSLGYHASARVYPRNER